MTCKCSNLACNPTHPEGRCPNQARSGFFCGTCKNAPTKHHGGITSEFKPFILENWEWCPCGGWHTKERR